MFLGQKEPHETKNHTGREETTLHRGESTIVPNMRETLHWEAKVMWNNQPTMRKSSQPMNNNIWTHVGTRKRKTLQ